MGVFWVFAVLNSVAVGGLIAVALAGVREAHRQEREVTAMVGVDRARAMAGEL